MESNNKQIAKNALFLYFRKGIAILIGLYSARLLLKELGDDDYGLYGLVGSIVMMFNAIRYLFPATIQRYMNVAKGTGNGSNVHEIFSVGMNIQIVLSIVFLLVVEIGGIILLPKLNIGTIPMWVVQMVFQFSVATVIISFLTVPYDAIIIASEKFNAYAYISIIDVFLRLIAVVLLVLVSEWKIIWYAIFLFISSIIVRIIYHIYCSKNFKQETKYIGFKNKKLCIEMLKFSGLNFIGSCGFWIMMSGTDFILNKFGGLVINASRNIANQIYSNFKQFVGDLDTSFRPKLMQLFCSGDFNEYYRLTFFNARLNFFVASILGFSFILLADFILRIWLTEVPKDAVIFCQTLILYPIIGSIRGPIDTFFKVVGKLKYFQISEFIITIVNLPISWLLLSNGVPLYWIFINMAILETVNNISSTLIATKCYQFKGTEYMKNVIIRAILLMILNTVICLLYFKLKYLVLNNIVYLILAFVPIIFIMAIEILTLFTRNERNKLIGIVANKLKI